MVQERVMDATGSRNAKAGEALHTVSEEDEEIALGSTFASSAAPMSARATGKLRQAVQEARGDDGSKKMVLAILQGTIPSTEPKPHLRTKSTSQVSL
eukprot:5360917-Amphidinium_carterae.1